MTVNSILPTALPVQGSGAVPDPKARGAAQQFESLLIAQLLKSTHESGGGWLGTGDDQSGQAAMDYAEEQFASALVAGGGLGLTKIIEKGLASSGQAAHQKVQD
jgi:Rod binding domain-containing protein